MNEFARPYSDDLQPFEEVIYSDFMETWDMLVTQQDLLHTAIAKTMSGEGGDTLSLAIGKVIEMKQAYIESLEEFTEVTFDTIESDEAAEIWAHVIDQAQQERLKLMKFIDERASFDPMPLSELFINAKAYAAGRERAHADGVIDGTPSDETDEPYEPIGIEQLHEIIESDDMEWENLTESSEGDEYAEWVLDEVCEILEDQIESMLELIPDDLYEE